MKAEGNWAYILLNGYKNDAFSLLKNKNKLHKLSQYDGVLWKEDLCLRALPLKVFVRRQNGYHNWSLNQIVNTLLDYSALCIQEEHTNLVKLSKDSDVPRVYRIKLDVLEEKKEYY